MNLVQLEFEFYWVSQPREKQHRANWRVQRLAKKHSLSIPAASTYATLIGVSDAEGGI